VVRGALVYGLYLSQQMTVLHHYQYESYDYAINTPDTWNLALLVDSQKPESSFLFQQAGAPGSVPFQHQNFPVTIKGKARQIPTWREVTNAAAPPPASPYVCGNCGQVVDVVLVPYGSTNLRITAFPWIDTNARRTR